MAQIPLINSDQFALVDDADYPWASQYIWRIDEDGHVVRDGLDEYGYPKVIYLCNEVMSRCTGIPLRDFIPPRGAKERRREGKRAMNAEIKGRLGLRKRWDRQI